MTRTHATHGHVSLERLESRVVLAATEVAIVGLTYDQVPYGEFDTPTPKIYRAYTIEGSISDDNILTSRTRWSGRGGAGPASPQRSTLLHLRDDGSFDYANARWPTTLREQGAQFLPDDGYAVGWWHAREFQDLNTGAFTGEFTTHAEDQLIVPLAPLTSLRAVEGWWDYSIHQRNQATGEDVIIRGTLGINATSRLVTFQPSGGGFPTVFGNVVGYTGGTRFHTDTGQTFFLSADRSTLVFADLDSSDQTVHVGVAVLSRPIVASEDVVGTYFITTNQGFDRSYASRLQINGDGTYTQEFLPAPHSATVTAPQVGRWQISYDREIALRPDNWTPEHRYAMSRSGGTLLQIASASGGTFFSMGRKAIFETTRSDPVAITSSISAEGRQLVFFDRSNAPWQSVDVAEASGGPEAEGPLFTWFDAGSGLARAAANTARGVTIYSEQANGSWSFNVLGESLGTGTVLVGGLAGTLGPGGRMNLFGLTGEGRLVRYVDGLGGIAGWTEWQVSRDRLEPIGTATPEFAGNLVAYAQPWGGLNISGIDIDGDLRTIWTAPLAGGWFVANISDLTGADTLTGDLDVAVTPRGDVRLMTTNASGEGIALFWNRVPGSQWNARVIYTSQHTFTGSLAATLQPLTGEIHIALMIDGSTHTVLYTLPAAFFTSPSVFPASSGVTGIANEDDHIVDGLSVRLGADGSVNIFGRNAEGDALRFQFIGNLVRAYENLSDLTV